MGESFAYSLDVGNFVGGLYDLVDLTVRCLIGEVEDALNVSDVAVLLVWRGGLAVALVGFVVLMIPGIIFFALMHCRSLRILAAAGTENNSPTAEWQFRSGGCTSPDGRASALPPVP